MAYATMAQIRWANRYKADGHFFERDTMRFFRSKIESSVIKGYYFITSEQYTDSNGNETPRRFTVRVCKFSGDIETVGQFQAYASKAEARAAIQGLLAPVTEAVPA